MLNIFTRQSNKEKKKTGRLQRAATLVFLLRKNMFRMIDSTGNVQILSQDENLLIEATRPTGCPCCGHHTLHRHGKYSRYVYTEDQRVRITVLRFLCTACRRTISILPDFIGRHQQMSWVVQEQVCAACEDGLSMEEAASTVSPPAGPISPRTVRKWWRKWRVLLEETQTQFWSAVFAIRAFVRFPVGQERPKSLYRWMNEVWNRVRKECGNICLFQMLQRLRHSSSS
jgi:transposase-like protein